MYKYIINKWIESQAAYSITSIYQIFNIKEELVAYIYKYVNAVSGKLTISLYFNYYKKDRSYFDCSHKTLEETKIFCEQVLKGDGFIYLNDKLINIL